jgi:hypothetical protein
MSEGQDDPGRFLSPLEALEIVVPNRHSRDGQEPLPVEGVQQQDLGFVSRGKVRVRKARSFMPRSFTKSLVRGC